MRFALSAAPLLFIASAAAAQQPQVERVEMFEAGIYERGTSSSYRGPDGVLQSVTEGERLVEATTRIPVRIGVAFGSRYRIEGQPEGSIATLRRVTRYPAPGARPPGAAAPLFESSAPQEVEIGGTSYADYKLEEEWELIPGTWTIEIWDGQRLLGSQQFTLVSPQTYALAVPRD